MKHKEKLLAVGFTEVEISEIQQIMEQFNGRLCGVKVRGKIYGNFNDWKGERDAKAKDSKKKSVHSKGTTQGDVQTPSFIPKTVPRSREYSSWKQYNEKRHPGVSG